MLSLNPQLSSLTSPETPLAILPNGAPSLLPAPGILPGTVAAESLLVQPVDASLDQPSEIPADLPVDPAPLLAWLLPDIQPPVLTPSMTAQPPAQVQAAAVATQPAALSLMASKPVIEAPVASRQATTSSLATPLITPPPVDAAPTAVKPLRATSASDVLSASRRVLEMMQKPSEALPLHVNAQPDNGINNLTLIQNVATHVLAQRDVQSANRQPISLPSDPAEAADTLRTALGERLQMQVDQRTQKATIRLDPPNMGKLDISLHFEAGKLQVSIQAAQPDVLRTLQQVATDLRHALSDHNQIQVNVQVSQQGGERRDASQHQTFAETEIDDNPEALVDTLHHHDRSVITRV